MRNAAKPAMKINHRERHIPCLVPCEFDSCGPDMSLFGSVETMRVTG